MGRKRLTIEEITSRYQDLKEILDELKEKRTEAPNDEEKNKLTKKISQAKKNLNNFKRQYVDRLSSEAKKEIKETKPTISYSRPSLKTKLKEIEEKANKLLQQTTDPTERKSILERLEACRLRLKYSY
jgi:MinD-like ATPase involved in chromosome partitioning or flagellar assembly